VNRVGCIHRFPWAWGAAIVLIASGALNFAAEDLSIERDGGAVRLMLEGNGGKQYSLEAIEALLNAGSEWRPVATVASPGSPVFLYDPTCSTRPQNFYRLRLLQATSPVFVPNFRLLDVDGRAHELFYQTDVRAVVLVLAGADLSSIASHAPALRRIRENHQANEVRVWILVTSEPDGREQIKGQAADLDLPFTILEDEAGTVTRQVGHGIAPEVAVFNPASYSFVYRGRIVDSILCAEGVVEQPLLENALRQHLAGKGVIIRETEAEGGPIVLPSVSSRTYEHDIAAILQNRCVKCHSPGNIAPWAMTNHAMVRDYAPLMKDEILTRRMPPWHADKKPQTYSNDQMLSPLEIATLVDWIDRGAPRGDGSDPLATAVPPPPPQWPLGTPDEALAIEPQEISASGTVDYRYLLLPNPYSEDVWLRAAVVKPGNPRVVHHVLVFSATTFNDILQIQAGLGGYFAAYVPGMEQVAFPEGTGKLLKKGSYLVFQLHYTATGQPETDLTELGLYLSPAPPQRELRTAAAYDLEFEIPPGAADHTTTAQFRLPRDGTLFELSPHMHYRGKWFRFDAIYPDGRIETLLNVPFYRFDWQTLYRLDEPKHLPAGTRIRATGGWDNSIRNPYNPDPGISVRFGEQSWEEMFIGYFNWADAL
jgi:hypothetical protein